MLDFNWIKQNLQEESCKLQETVFTIFSKSKSF